LETFCTKIGNFSFGSVGTVAQNRQFFGFGFGTLFYKTGTFAFFAFGTFAQNIQSFFALELHMI
jgi:hypothetical protein